MKRRTGRAVLLIPVSILILAAGCDDHPADPADPYPPAVPRGLTSITGDGEVELRWFPNGERDMHGYRVYRSRERSGYYSRIAWVSAPSGNVYQVAFVDRPLQNGQTCWYAVSAVDYSGNESDLTWEEVFDTPRPEGRGVRLRNYNQTRRGCAFDFSDRRVTDFDVIAADIAYAWDQDRGGVMIGLDDPATGYVTELQDAGYHPMEAVGWAPPNGWSPLAMVELIEGHVYVVWTRDDHYAKFRAIRVQSNEVEFDWAYQTARGNQELRAGGAFEPDGIAASGRRAAPIARRAAEPTAPRAVPARD